MSGSANENRPLAPGQESAPTIQQKAPDVLFNLVAERTEPEIAPNNQKKPRELSPAASAEGPRSARPADRPTEPAAAQPATMAQSRDEAARAARLASDPANDPTALADAPTGAYTRDGEPFPPADAKAQDTAPQDTPTGEWDRVEVLSQSDVEVCATAEFSLPEVPLAIPGYQILGVLGRGGMGVVYKAMQTGLKRIVALKMILAGAHAGPEEEARFRLEVEAVAQLQHPNIVQVYEVGRYEKRPYCALEFIAGGNLDGRLKGEPQPALLAARLMEALAGAMHAAHERGIIHRDLKPANILLAGAPDTPLEQCTPKICDFGLAKQIDDDSHHTRSGAIMGTPSYMAPEQAEGHTRDVGPACDVYALGAILYDLLTGRPPFKAASVIDTLDQVRQQEPVPPSWLEMKVPRDLETICLKCLQKEPHKRYASAAALAEDLRRFQNREPILARRTGTVERVVKWARRRPALATLLAVVVLVVGGLIAASVYAAAARRQHQEQIQATARDQIRQARHAMDSAAWDEANGALAGAEVALGSEAGHEELRAEVADLQETVNGRRSQQADRRRVEDKLRDFRKLRDDSLFHATLSIGEELADNLRLTDHKAREALALFGITVDTDTAPHFDDALKPNEKKEIQDDCYLLLLVLAQAVGQPRPRQTKVALASSSEEALSILERARQFGIETRAFHLRRARYLGQLGRAVQAGVENRQANQHAPTLALDYYLVGDELYKQGDIEEATGCFENVLAQKPEDFWARYYLALCYVRVGRPAEARTFLTACLNQRKDLVWLYLMRGFACCLLADYVAAETDFARAETMLQAEPTSEARYALYTSRAVLRYRQTRLAQATDDLSRAIALRPQRYQAYLTRAQIYQTQALEELRRVLAICPEPYQACVTLAQVYHAEKNWDAALDSFNEAIRLQRDSAFLYRNRAQLYLERMDLDRALADFAETIRKSQADPTADPHELARDHLERGKILLVRKEYGAAARACDEAVALWPQFAEAYVYRAKALLDRPAADAAERARSCEAAVRSLEAYRRNGGKPRVDVYLARAQALTILHGYVKAIEAYTLALEQKPDDAALRAARGRLHLAKHAPELARDDFDRAIELDPANGEAYIGRAQAHATAGEYEQAVADADRAVGLGGASPQLLAEAARTYGLAIGQVDLELSRLQPVSQVSKIEADRRLRAEYNRKAVELLRRALADLPAQQRPAFWRDRVLGDSALEAVRRGEEFQKLKAEYAGLARK
jgi:tetratricopeptide (TPR) repeat protein